MLRIADRTTRPWGKPAQFLPSEKALTRLTSEQRSEAFFAGARKIHDAAAWHRIARRPVQFGEAVHHGGTQRAGEGMAAFAPVEAGLTHGTARMRQRLGVDLQRLSHEALALAGEFDVLFCLPDQPLLAQ